MKSIGATYGRATPHTATAVLLKNNTGLFDFVITDKTLCQISDIQIKSDLSIEDAKAIATGKKRVPMHDIIAKLDVLVRRSQPIMPGSVIKPATNDEIIEFLLGNHDVLNHIGIGKLLRRDDVGFYLGGHFLNNHLAILGMIGMGKSNAGKVIQSQVNWRGARVVVIDPHAEYKAGEVINVDKFKVDTENVDVSKALTRLREAIPAKQEKILERVERAVRNNMPDESIKSFTTVCSDEYVQGGSTILPALMEAIRTESVITYINQAIKTHEYKKPLIINLKGLKKANTQALVKQVADLILTMGKEGTGSYLFIDEAQTFVPQRGTPECKTAIIDLITEGRKFNCGVILMSQRPARVDKDVLSQCNSKIILKLTNENDIKQVRASTEFSTKAMFDEVQKLRRGEALLVSATVERPVFIKVDKYESGSLES